MASYTGTNGGKASKEAVREARKALRRAIKKARRECWENFLGEAYGENVWAVQRYISPKGAFAVPSITHQGRTASEHQDKVDMLASISFPPPEPYDGNEGQEGPPGRAFEKVDDFWVLKAARGISGKKSPASDGISPLAIRMLFLSWDTQRIVAIIRVAIRLGHHPAQ